MSIIFGFATGITLLVMLVHKQRKAVSSSFTKAVLNPPDVPTNLA
jgi:hypothetical protein